MKQVVLGTGKVDGTQVNHVLGSLAHHADIPGREIGKIRIQNRQTLVDVCQGLAAGRVGLFRLVLGRFRPRFWNSSDSFAFCVRFARLFSH